jgi:hypothetical protein
MGNVKGQMNVGNGRKGTGQQSGLDEFKEEGICQEGHRRREIPAVDEDS